jgi:hypothetical protein
MKTWFASLNGAITLSFCALSIELFRAFLDFSIIIPQEFKGKELIGAAIYAVIFGLWGAGLLVARGGKRWGMVAAFAVGLLFLVGLDVTTTLPILCPNGCGTIWFNIAAGAGLIVGGLALVAWVLQFRKKSLG